MSTHLELAFSLSSQILDPYLIKTREERWVW